jgi:hypothetical protein
MLSYEPADVTGLRHVLGSLKDATLLTLNRMLHARAQPAAATSATAGPPADAPHAHAHEPPLFASSGPSADGSHRRGRHSATGGWAVADIAAVAHVGSWQRGLQRLGAAGRSLPHGWGAGKVRLHAAQSRAGCGASLCVHGVGDRPSCRGRVAVRAALQSCDAVWASPALGLSML